jgi:hypothetical protein
MVDGGFHAIYADPPSLICITLRANWSSSRRSLAGLRLFGGTLVRVPLQSETQSWNPATPQTTVRADTHMIRHLEEVPNVSKLLRHFA